MSNPVPPFEQKLSSFILFFLRDKAKPWATEEEVLAFLETDEDFSETIRRRYQRVNPHEVRRQLTAMHECGLIEQRSGLGIRPRGYRIAERFADIQYLVGFSLRSIIAAKAHTIAVEPVFGSPEAVDADVFVIMPFDGHLSDVYNIHIKKVCAEIGVSCHRGDDLFTTNNIIDDIWSSIFHAKVIVADCTFRNPNVFYELGIAHALGKPVILLTQGGDDVPFDLKQRRYIEYGTSEAKRTAFETKLKSFIRDAMSK